MNSSLRKDSKKDFCFEISATDKRSYMVGGRFYTLLPLPVLSATKRLKNRFFYAHVFCIIWLSQLLGGNVRHNPRFSLWLQFCASSVKEAEEWVKQIDFVLKGPNASYHNQTFLQQNSSSQKKNQQKNNFSVCRYDGHHSWRRRGGSGTVRRCGADGWDLRSAPRSDQTYIVWQIWKMFYWSVLNWTIDHCIHWPADAFPHFTRGGHAKPSSKNGASEQTSSSSSCCR